MKKVVLALAVFSLSISGKLNGQVTLSPEIGLSYAHFNLNLHCANCILTMNPRVDYLVGLSGEVALLEKWTINMRLSYSDRQDVNLIIFPFFGEIYKDIVHSDLNIDFNVRYHLWGKVSVWAGPSIVRKINSSLHRYTDPNSPWGYDSYTVRLDSFIYGFNLAASISIKELILKLEYARLKWEPEINSMTFSGINRYNLTLSYPVFTGKKR